MTSEREEIEKFRAECNAEFDHRVASGEIDLLSERQPLIAPKRDKTLVGCELEMWFGHPTNDWYRGKVVGIMNEKTDRVRIVWNEDDLHEDDPRETTQVLKRTKYNPETTSEGAWRQYFK